MSVNNQLGELVGVDLRDQDLRGRDLSGKTLFGTDLRGAKLFGATISLECQTFDGCKLDDVQIASLLLMLALADIDSQWKDGIYSLIKEVVGTDKSAALARLLKVI